MYGIVTCNNIKTLLFVDCPSVDKMQDKKVYVFHL